MKLQEKGVLPESDIYIFPPSLEKKDWLYQMLCTGSYVCNADYRVDGCPLDSYLLLFVTSGRLFFGFPDGRRDEVEAGRLAIVNCYERPSYGACEDTRFMWIHFDGHGIDEMYRNMMHHVVNVSDMQSMERCFRRILDPLSSGLMPPEAIVNKYITCILTEFFCPDDIEGGGIPGRRFDKVCSYIGANIERRLTNDELASVAGMSTFHFIRAFRRETGLTPHEYVIRSRIGTAVFLLRTTRLSLSEVAYRCGFSTESAFANAFKSYTGATPLGCRRMARDDDRLRDRLADTSLILDI